MKYYQFLISIPQQDYGYKDYQLKSDVAFPITLHIQRLQISRGIKL